MEPCFSKFITVKREDSSKAKVKKALFGSTFGGRDHIKFNIEHDTEIDIESIDGFGKLSKDGIVSERVTDDFALKVRKVLIFKLTHKSEDVVGNGTYKYFHHKEGYDYSIKTTVNRVEQTRWVYIVSLRRDPDPKADTKEYLYARVIDEKPVFSKD
jgi:hypothetical protein